jgi:hypothetical protein
VVDESFDRIAAQQVKNCLANYDSAPESIKLLLENIAVAQELESWWRLDLWIRRIVNRTIED